MSRIHLTLAGLTAWGLALLLLCTFSVSVVKAANNSEQVVFSGTGGGSFTPAGGTATPSPFGFWIWCEADSTNPYLGQCAGAMYIYALGLTKGVNGTITELGTNSGIYMMSVASADGTISCALHNAATAKKGPNNTVIAVCSAPAGGGTSTNAIVNVTGP